MMNPEPQEELTEELTEDKSQINQVSVHLNWPNLNRRLKLGAQMTACFDTVLKITKDHIIM